MPLSPRSSQPAHFAATDGVTRWAFDRCRSKSDGIEPERSTLPLRVMVTLIPIAESTAAGGCLGVCQPPLMHLPGLFEFSVRAGDESVFFFPGAVSSRGDAVSCSSSSACTRPSRICSRRYTIW